MNDLLGDVKVHDEGEARPPRRQRRGQAENPAYNGNGPDVEMASFAPPPSDHEAAMQTFFTAVEEIKKDMKTIREAETGIEELHERGKTLVKSKDVQKARQEMQVTCACI